MPRKDLFHETVKNALTADGWTVTDDPLRIKLGDQKLYVDLGAERPLNAERNGEKIAVEVKSFVGISLIQDIQNALGQYRLYLYTLQRQEPERTLFLALSEEIYLELSRNFELREFLLHEQINFLVIDGIAKEIKEWTRA